MRDDVLVSIIVPVYKVEDTIGRTLDSVFSQGADDNMFEVIVVDDGTPDRSMDVVREFSRHHSNIKVIKKKNEGVSAARNDAMHDAVGEYILFLDGDDTLSPGVLNDIFSFFAEEDWDPELVVMRERYVSGKEKYGWEDRDFKYKAECAGCEYTFPMDSKQIFQSGYFRATVTGILFRRNELVARCIHFNPAIQLGEDLVFVNMLLPFLHEVVFWNRDLYIVHEREGSASRTFDDSRFESCRYALEFMSDLAGDAREGNHLNTLSILDYARFKMLMHYMKYTIRYGIKDGFRKVKAIVPDNYFPLYMENTPNEGWKMAVLNRSLKLFYILLKLQNKFRMG